MFVLYVLFNSCRARIIRVYIGGDIIYDYTRHVTSFSIFPQIHYYVQCTYYNIDEWNIYYYRHTIYYYYVRFLTRKLCVRGFVPFMKLPYHPS